MSRSAKFKMDPHLVSHQKSELDYIVKKFKKEHIIVTSEQIKNFTKQKDIGRSRKKVYAAIRAK